VIDVLCGSGDTDVNILHIQVYSFNSLK